MNTNTKSIVSKIIILIVLVLILGGIYSLSPKSYPSNSASAIDSTNTMTTIIIPNGGETYKIGDALNITWKIGTNPIEIAVEGYGKIDTKINPITGKYTWKVGDIYNIDSTGKKVLSKLPSGKYYIRLSDLKTGQFSRSSTAFTLTN